jgi:hypothetical protein
MKASVVVLPLLFLSGSCTPLESIAAHVFGSLQQVLEFAGQLTENSWRLTTISKHSPSIRKRCSNLKNGAFHLATWTVSTDTFCPNHFSTAPYVSNGYFGQSLPSEAVGYWIEKRPDGSLANNGGLVP